MRLTNSRKWLLFTGLSTVIFGFFLVLAIIMWVWFSPILIFVFASGIALPIYFRHKYRHSNKKEKERMVAQKAISSYYYNQWYNPADSNYLENAINTEKLKKSKKR